jgi:hypothetical protein
LYLFISLSPVSIKRWIMVNQSWCVLVQVYYNNGVIKVKSPIESCTVQSLH